jgi:hypothetical protein
MSPYSGRESFSHRKLQPNVEVRARLRSQAAVLYLRPSLKAQNSLDMPLCVEA